MSTWQVVATIGGTTFTATRVTTDPPPEATLPALLSVRWSHDLERTDEAWPTRTALTTATVQLLMDTAAEAATWGPGTVVHLEFLAEVGGAVVDSYSGRASFPEIEPHEVGVLVTITVSSYLLDLSGYPTGGGVMPSETPRARLNREMGWGLGVAFDAMTLAARPVGLTNLLALVQDTLFGSLADSEVNPALPPKWGMYEVTAEVDSDGNLDPLFPWGIVELERRSFLTDPPLLVRENPDDPGTYELWADPDDPATADAVVDGNLVEFRAKWSRRLDRQTNTIHVQLADGTYWTASNAEPGEGLVAYTRETQLAGFADAEVLADFLLPDRQGPAEPSAWEAESFTVLLNHTPDGWYPKALRGFMALSDVQRHHHPEALTYLVGMVTGLALEATGDEARVTVTLEGHRVYSDPPGILTIDDVPHAIDAMHPAFTFDAAAWARP